MLFTPIATSEELENKNSWVNTSYEYPIEAYNSFFKFLIGLQAHNIIYGFLPQPETEWFMRLDSLQAYIRPLVDRPRWVIGPSCYPRTTGHSLKAALNVPDLLSAILAVASAPASTGRPSTEPWCCYMSTSPGSDHEGNSMRSSPGLKSTLARKRVQPRNRKRDTRTSRSCAGGAKKNGVPTARGDKSSTTVTVEPLRFAECAHIMGAYTLASPNNAH